MQNESPGKPGLFYLNKRFTFTVANVHLAHEKNYAVPHFFDS